MNGLRRILRQTRLLATSLREEGLGFVTLWPRVRGTVPGWLTGADARLLYALAHHGPGRGPIVEIGSAWGRSTIVLASASKRARREKVHAIDPHTGDPWYLHDASATTMFSSLERFRENLRRFAVDDYVTEVVATSEQAARDLDVRGIRLLYVDGLHTYEAVRADIRDWVPRVVAGGVVVFDDYFNDREGIGVRAAVDELLASGTVGPPRRADALLWMDKLVGAPAS